ncbi:hypothetical protein MMC30_004679 [Trapelia coarctata]|nr:hypothetical protein [Trapelia coarctata]
MDASIGKPPEQPADTDFAQVFKDLTRGEQTAAAMESKLTSLEQRIDELLASVEEKDDKAKSEQPMANGTGSDGARKNKGN